MDNYGKIFEKKILQECGTNITCVRIPDQVVGFYGGKRGAQIKTPFDFAAGIDGFAAFFDAKACGVGKFNFKSLLLRDKKVHQFEALKQAYKNNNLSGLLIWFYKTGWYSWINVETLINAINKGEKGISHDYPNVVSQRDDRPLDLRTLLSNDFTMKCYAAG